MRYILTRGAALLLCVSMLMSSALASGPVETVERIDCGDGAYLTITTTVYITNARASSRYAEKKYDYTDAAGDTAFIYTLRGWFTYDTKSSTATDADAVIDVYKSGWSLSSHREYCSGSTAYGSATFKGPAGPQSVSGSITCDKNGSIR